MYKQWILNEVIVDSSMEFDRMSQINTNNGLIYKTYHWWFTSKTIAMTSSAHSAKISSVRLTIYLTYFPAHIPSVPTASIRSQLPIILRQSYVRKILRPATSQTSDWTPQRGRLCRDWWRSIKILVKITSFSGYSLSANTSSKYCRLRVSRKITASSCFRR